MAFEDIACLLLDAIQRGEVSIIVAALVALLVFGLRTLVAPRVPFFSSDLGGASLAFLVGFSGALLTAAIAGAELSLSLFLNAANVSLIAMGGYSAFKKMLRPLIVRGLARLGFTIQLDTFTKALQASEPKIDLQKR
jgi:hypothetical protein